MHKSKRSMYMSSTFKAVEYDVVTHHEAVTGKDPWDEVIK